MARKMQLQRKSLAAKLVNNLAVLLVVLLLAACAYDPSTILRSPRTVDAVVDKDAEPKPAKAATTLPPEITDAAQKPDQVAAVEIDLTNFKERLLGLDSSEITELLGKPKFDRNEPPARIWQFQSKDCFVDLFLFDDEGSLTVDHVEVRGKKVEKINEKICFASILNMANDGDNKATPVGPLQPAPGAVKVPPVTQAVPSEDDGGEITPPNLIKAEPDLPTIKPTDPPAEKPVAAPGAVPQVKPVKAEPTQEAPTSGDPEIPSFGPDEKSEEDPGEDTEEMPSFDPDEPPDKPLAKPAPKASVTPSPTPGPTPEKISGDDEEDTPSVEFIMEPVPEKSSQPTTEPADEEPPQLEAAPAALPAEPPTPLKEPEADSKESPGDVPAVEVEATKPDTAESQDTDTLGSEANSGEARSDNTPSAPDLLPNAPKLGTTQSEDDLLEEPAP